MKTNKIIILLTILLISITTANALTGEVEGNLIVDTNTLYVNATNNRVGIGTTSPEQKLHVTGYGLFEVDSYAEIMGWSHSNTSWQGSFFEARRTRGTKADPLAVQSGDVIGNLDYWGYNGSSYDRMGQIRLLVDGSVSTGVLPSRLEFLTRDTTGLATRMTIKNDGKVLFGTDTNLYRTGTSVLKTEGSLNVTGDILYGGNLISYSPMVVESADNDKSVICMKADDSNFVGMYIRKTEAGYEFAIDATACKDKLDKIAIRRNCIENGKMWDYNEKECVEKPVETKTEVYYEEPIIS